MAYLNPEPPRRKPGKTALLIVVPVIILGLLAFAVLREKENPEVTYYKRLMEAEKLEYRAPRQFLKSEGTYRKTLFGPKYRIEGHIANTAATATYKDAIVEVSFFSKTKTLINSTRITVYEVFPPKAVKNFNVKVEAPPATETIGWKVVDAARN